MGPLHPPDDCARFTVREPTPPNLHDAPIAVDRHYGGSCPDAQFTMTELAQCIDVQLIGCKVLSRLVLRLKQGGNKLYMPG
jgi:hypothetical protein